MFYSPAKRVGLPAGIFSGGTMTLSRVKRAAFLASVEQRYAARAPLGPPSPGLILRNLLLARKLSQRHVAAAMGVSAVAINHIVHGRHAITAEMAFRLGRATDTSPRYWLRLQAEFDLGRVKHRLAGSLDELPELTTLGKGQAARVQVTPEEAPPARQDAEEPGLAAA